MGSKVLLSHYTDFYYATIVTLTTLKRIVFATVDGAADRRPIELKHRIKEDLDPPTVSFTCAVFLV